MLLIFATGSTGLAVYVLYMLVSNYMYGSREIVKIFFDDFGIVFPLCAFSGIVAIIFQLKVIGLEKPAKPSGIIDDIYIEQRRKTQIAGVYTIGHVLFCISLLLFGLIFVPGVITHSSDHALESFMLIVTPVFFGASGLVYTADIIKKLREIKISHRE